MTLTHQPAKFSKVRGDRPQFFAQIKTTIASVIDYLMRFEEPKVRQTIVGHQPAWFVYDPRTQKSAFLASEAEVRVWIESRYNC